MTPTEALARIAALCGGFQADGHGDAVSITAVRAVLAEVTPEAGVTLTPEEAALAAEALHIGQETLDDYADQFSDVDARLDGGEVRTAAAGMRTLAARLEAAS